MLNDFAADRIVEGERHQQELKNSRLDIEIRQNLLTVRNEVKKFKSRARGKVFDVYPSAQQIFNIEKVGVLQIAIIAIVYVENLGKKIVTHDNCRRQDVLENKLLSDEKLKDFNFKVTSLLEELMAIKF